MSYRFTAILILLFIGLTMFAKPAYPRNEYLNNGTNTCNTGSFDISVEQRDSDYNHRNYSPSSNYDNYNDDRSLRLTYRHYLGSACTNEFKKVQQENMKLKQQLELMKMCGRVNANPSLAYNENFNLLVTKCTGVAPVKLDNRPADGKSKWDELKDDYKKENPDIKLMNDKIIGPKNEN